MSTPTNYRPWLIGFSLLGILALAGGAYLKGLVRATALTVPVNIISDCTVDKDQLPVGVFDTVIWIPPPPPDKSKYSVHFLKKIPFLSSVSDVPTSQGNIVFGDSECPFGESATTKCYFPYVVFRDGKKCGDPGVHVGPPRFFYSKASK